MIDYSAEQFQAVCRTSAVQERTTSLDAERRSAVRRFWVLLGTGLVLGVAIIVSLILAGWIISGWVLGLVVMIGGLLLGVIPVFRVSEGLKRPVLEGLAQSGGLEYLAADFEPPVFSEARTVLFGNSLSGQVFTDLFQGTDAEERRFALYEAHLTKRSGKSHVTVFSGQIYAFQRRLRGKGAIAIVPDRGIFNFFKPVKGLERVRFESDEAFEKKFEVFAERPTEALMFLRTDIRHYLLELRQRGRVFAYVGTEDVLVAASDRNRFEAGSMFNSEPAEARVKRMFDELCQSLAQLKQVRRTFD